MVDGRSRRHAHAHTNRQTKQTETYSERSMYGHTGSVPSRKGFREFAKAHEGAPISLDRKARAHACHIVSKRLAPRMEAVRHRPFSKPIFPQIQQPRGVDGHVTRHGCAPRSTGGQECGRFGDAGGGG